MRESNAVDFRPDGFVCDVTIAANNLLAPNKRTQSGSGGYGNTVH